MKLKGIYWAASGLLLCGRALATEPIFLATSDHTLFRAHNSTVETFSIPDVLRGATFDPIAGRVIAVGPEEDAAGHVPVYEIVNTETGIPALTRISTLTRFYGSITKTGDLFYGTSQGALYSIDLSNPANPIETRIGTHGLVNTGGLAYNAAHSTLFIGSSETDALYTLNLQTAAPTLVGSFGIQSLWMGMEAWEGQLFAAMQNGTSGRFELGTLSDANGTFQPVFDLAGLADPSVVSLAIIPEPAPLVALAMAAAVLTRRRRGRRSNLLHHRVH